MKVIQPRQFNLRKTIVVASVILVLGIVTFTRDPLGPEHIQWTGSSMGTSYAIRIAHSTLSQVEVRKLKNEVNHYLKRINNEMSTYLPDSEISAFNRRRDTQPITVSPSFAHVVRAALTYAESTQGTFDPTLDPLLNLWGFGHRGEPESAPSSDQIETVMVKVGYHLVEVTDDHALQKTHPDVQLNLNAIAKGYAVDGLAQLALEAGVTNVYVEIGGDVVAYGVNREGLPWRVGIENPDPEAKPGQSLHGIAHISGVGLATSGDYRNFRVDANGHVTAHILDPRLGRPVTHTLASVAVIADTCMEADAMATALYVMGSEEGMQWVEASPAVEALFFDRQPDGSFEPAFSSGFQSKVNYTIIP